MQAIQGKRVVPFLKREPVLTLAAVCALLSMLPVPPDRGYAAYVDLRVLCLLFCLMLVVAGTEDCGVFAVLAQRLLAGRKRFRLLALILVLLPFFSSMLITNDVSLITFVPFTILVLGLIGRTRERIYLIVLQTVAANLGSMAMPVGNPQNLFLCSRFQIPMRDFFSTLLPLTLVSLAGLTAAALCTSGDPIQVEFRDVQRLEKGGQLRVMAGLFALCLLSVFRVLHYGVLTAVVIAAGLAVNRQLFRRVDYGLLATFFCFFVFSGNLGRIGAVRDWLTGLLEGHTGRRAACWLYRGLAGPAGGDQRGGTGDPDRFPGLSDLLSGLSPLGGQPSRTVSRGVYPGQSGGAGPAGPVRLGDVKKGPGWDIPSRPFLPLAKPV